MLAYVLHLPCSVTLCSGPVDFGDNRDRPRVEEVGGIGSTGFAGGKLSPLV